MCPVFRASQSQKSRTWMLSKYIRMQCITGQACIQWIIIFTPEYWHNQRISVFFIIACLSDLFLMSNQSRHLFRKVYFRWISSKFWPPVTFHVHCSLSVGYATQNYFFFAFLTDLYEKSTTSHSGLFYHMNWYSKFNTDFKETRPSAVILWRT